MLTTRGLESRSRTNAASAVLGIRTTDNVLSYGRSC